MIVSFDDWGKIGEKIFYMYTYILYNNNLENKAMKKNPPPPSLKKKR